MQSAKVIVVLVALSQVECAPPSIWPAHRFSPPELWPFKQQPAAPAPQSLFTHFPGSTPPPADIAVPAEAVITESIIDAGNPLPVEVHPTESSLPSEIIVQEVVEVESAAQAQVPVEFVNKNVTQELVAEIVTEVPVETTTVTTAAPTTIRYQDTETYRAYEQFLSTWLQQASLTLNRPELLNMVTQRKQNIITPEESPAKPSVSQSVEKSIEKVVEQVTVSESIEPQATPIKVVSPEITEITKKTSGPLKKTPATLITNSATDAPLITDIEVIGVESVLTPVPVPSSENAVPSEPLEVTFISSEPALESQNLDIVTKLELINAELVPENPPVQENIAEVDFVAEPLFLQPELVPSPEVAVQSEPLEITVKASDPTLESRNLEVVATPDQIVFEALRENTPIQEQTISDVELVAEPSFLQPVVVAQPAVEEFVLAAESQLPESSYSKLAVSPAGTILLAPNPPAILSSAQPALPEPTLEPAVIETFSPQGLTYTLKYFPRQGSSFFYSHALGG